MVLQHQARTWSAILFVIFIYTSILIPQNLAAKEYGKNQLINRVRKQQSQIIEQLTQANAKEQILELTSQYPVIVHKKSFGDSACPNSSNNKSCLKTRFNDLKEEITEQVAVVLHSSKIVRFYTIVRDELKISNKVEIIRTLCDDAGGYRDYLCSKYNEKNHAWEQSIFFIVKIIPQRCPIETVEIAGVCLESQPRLNMDYYPGISQAVYGTCIDYIDARGSKAVYMSKSEEKNLISNYLDEEPAVCVTRAEADEFCRKTGGRVPKLNELQLFLESSIRYKRSGFAEWVLSEDVHHLNSVTYGYDPASGSTKNTSVVVYSGKSIKARFIGFRCAFSKMGE